MSEAFFSKIVTAMTKGGALKLLIRIAGAAVCDATKFNRSSTVGAKIIYYCLP